MATVKRTGAAEGARRCATTGYVKVWLAGRWRAEHRVVAEQQLGRHLKRSEVVHHLNQRRDDNRPSNLMVFGSSSAHARYHGGHAVRPVWDGRTGQIARPVQPGDGPTL